MPAFPIDRPEPAAAAGPSGAECEFSIVANVDASDQVMLYPPLSHDEFVARLLVDIWTLATGRTLRCDVPPHELTTEELIDFWSDDHLDAETALLRIRHGSREVGARQIRVSDAAASLFPGSSWCLVAGGGAARTP